MAEYMDHAQTTQSYGNDWDEDDFLCEEPDDGLGQYAMVPAANDEATPVVSETSESYASGDWHNLVQAQADYKKWRAACPNAGSAMPSLPAPGQHGDYKGIGPPKGVPNRLGSQNNGAPGVTDVEMMEDMFRTPGQTLRIGFVTEGEWR